MIAAAVPADEELRLAELHALRLLDTPPETRFDRITRLASQVFGVPISYIALIDSDRQWFKSSCGLSASSTDRSISFCGHTILQSQPLVVPDALKDERFHDNPLVTQPPGVRFYAGYPLRGPSGRNIGTLCLADSKPRPAETIQIEMFEEFAGIAEDELCMVDLIETQRELIEVKDVLLTTKRRLDEELRNAAEYVQSLLPEDLERPHLRITSSFVPSSELGGDFIGSVAIDDTRIAVFLLDVTGHGVAASLLAVSISHAIRECLRDPSLAADPGAVLTRINSAYPMQQNGNRFATAWLGIFDEQTAEVRHACAGHHPALVIGSGYKQRLGESELPVGVVDDTRYITASAQMQPGDRLYLYSDGVFEVPLPSGKQLGLEGFELLVEEAARSGEHPVRDLIDTVRRLGGIEQFSDDATLLEVVLR